MQVDPGTSAGTAFRRILVLAPHTDDGEFGCGGTIARYAEGGSDVFYATFSLCEESVPSEFPRNILEMEVREATAALGIPPANLIIYRYPVRRLPEVRQDILENLIQLKKEIDPDLVLLPSKYDLHQDHNQVAMEGLRAFKDRCLMGYEVPWNNLIFQTLAFVLLEERHVQKKIEALACYRSQSSKLYADPEYIRGLARTRGVEIGSRFAECYEVMRWVLR